jgi:predicted alpha/beta-fold hydrolase
MEEKAGPPAFVARPFRAARWLPGAHGQTIGGRLFRRPEPLPFRRERIETPDGDFLDLDFPEVVPAGDRGESPVVLLLHGLEGSARRGYAIETYRALARRGVRAVGLNFRSCSGESNRTARFYHSGETTDIAFVAAYLAARFPDVALGAIGFSLGGNALLKFLGESADAGLKPFHAAAAISVPYDLAAGAKSLDATPMGRFYTRIFVRSLIEKAEAKRLLLEDVCDIDAIRRAKSFYEFDNVATAPLHGFADADDYYRRSSSRGFVSRIDIPTLLVHSRDDPFLPAAAIPIDEFRRNPCLTVAITEKGGHVGFIEGPPWRPRFWAEEEAARFLAFQLTTSAPAR